MNEVLTNDDFLRRIFQHTTSDLVLYRGLAYLNKQTVQFVQKNTIWPTKILANRSREQLNAFLTDVRIVKKYLQFYVELPLINHSKRSMDKEATTISNLCAAETIRTLSVKSEHVLNMPYANIQHLIVWAREVPIDAKILNLKLSKLDVKFQALSLHGRFFDLDKVNFGLMTTIQSLTLHFELAVNIKSLPPNLSKLDISIRGNVCLARDFPKLTNVKISCETMTSNSVVHLTKNIDNAAIYDFSINKCELDIQKSYAFLNAISTIKHGTIVLRKLTGMLLNLSQVHCQVLDVSCETKKGATTIGLKNELSVGLCTVKHLILRKHALDCVMTDFDSRSTSLFDVHLNHLVLSAGCTKTSLRAQFEFKVFDGSHHLCNLVSIDFGYHVPDSIKKFEKLEHLSFEYFDKLPRIHDLPSLTHIKITVHKQKKVNVLTEQTTLGFLRKELAKKSASPIVQDTLGHDNEQCNDSAADIQTTTTSQDCEMDLVDYFMNTETSPSKKQKTAHAPAMIDQPALIYPSDLFYQPIAPSQSSLNHLRTQIQEIAPTSPKKLNIVLVNPLTCLEFDVLSDATMEDWMISVPCNILKFDGVPMQSDFLPIASPRCCSLELRMPHKIMFCKQLQVFSLEHIKNVKVALNRTTINKNIMCEIFCNWQNIVQLDVSFDSQHTPVYFVSRIPSTLKLKNCDVALQEQPIDYTIKDEMTFDPVLAPYVCLRNCTKP